MSQLTPAQETAELLQQALLETDAEGKALELLITYLTPHQKMTMRWHNFFYQLGGHKWYALYDGVLVLELHRGLPVMFRGIFSRAALPKGDKLLAQLLMLRTNPKLVDDIACSTPVMDHSVWGYRHDVMPLLRERTYFPGAQS